jgi:SAM-dependent methyltransferase
MNPVEYLHQGYVHGRRVRLLSEHLSRLLPSQATVLDVGCGDGLLASLILARRPDLTIHGIDVAARPGAHIPITLFDGSVIPHEDGQYDVVLFVDVLHHTLDPLILLREGTRVARRALVLKDHLREGFLAGPTLRFMDRVGNARHGTSLPYNYWSRQHWLQAFQTLGWAIDVWEQRLGLYPWPASWVFERGLHFVVRLARVGEETESHEANRIA